VKRLLNGIRNHYGFILGIIILLVLTFFTSRNILEKQFDESIFEGENVYNHIRELSSPMYNGRYPGTEGNRLALQYVEDYFKEIGIEPGGENGSFYQQLESMVPFYESTPYIRIIDGENNIVREFHLRKDYVDTFFGGGEVQGELLLLNKSIRNYSKEELMDKIIVGWIPQHIQAGDIQYAVDHGVRAVLTTTDHEYYRSKTVRMSKASTNFGQIKLQGKPIIINIMGRSAYFELRRYAEEKMKADIKYDMVFKRVKTPNILGKIEGKKPDSGTIIISGHVDHVGSDMDGSYFPGAFDDASGIGMMLELARVIKAQDNLPEKTIIFAGWNNEENGLNGSRYYVEHPVYPLARTQVIQIDGIGLTEIKEIIFDSAGDKGVILRNMLFQYAKDLEDELGIKVREIEVGRGSDHQFFIEHNIPSVLIQDFYENRSDLHYVHMYEDNIDNISLEQINRGGKILLQYLKREVYQDILPDYLNKAEKSIIIGIAVTILFFYAVNIWKNRYPSKLIWNKTAEELYFSVPYQLGQRFCQFTILTIFIVFMLVSIIQVPTNFNLIIEEGQIYSNLSLYLVVKKSILYIRHLLTGGLGTSIRNIKVWDIVIVSFKRSSQLIIVSIVLSTIFGMIKGVLDGYNEKGRSGVRGFGTLLLLSLPDVLIVLIAQIMMIYLYKHNILSGYVDKPFVQKFLVPLGCLSIVPFVYVSRITTVAVQDEKKKYYIKAAKAKGLSDFKIICSHITIGVIIKLIDSLSSLTTIIISNLIIVEYLFHYPGIIYMLLKAYKESDITTFIGLSISLGVMYVLFIAIFIMLSKIINPMKREHSA